ncbi:MAG: hypothetical protein JXL84_12570 [Deltaproteobacteria bacterium]|nr:hypothetical protein [Deltaproteobacteria bacterium]
MNSPIPVLLFAYARPDHLRRTLDSLRHNHVPIIYAFSDGPKGREDHEAVKEVRRILRGIDWCDFHLLERTSNLGLGRSVLEGVTSVLHEKDKFVVFEDDLVCVPGTYDYLCAALRHYEDDPRVMSVTGWTHPRVTPSDVIDQPYFDGRAECLVWGTWARAWEGMDQDARTLMNACRRRGIDIYRYGADLPAMAEAELTKNIWAVRFLYLHILRGGLCLRPPQSMVEHIGFDPLATNANDGSSWPSYGLKPCPPLPTAWPDPHEHPECPHLWQGAYGSQPRWLSRVHGSLRRLASTKLRHGFLSRK